MSYAETINELRASLREGAERWDTLAQMWRDLTPVQQTELVETARAMLARVPQSLRA